MHVDYNQPSSPMADWMSNSSVNLVTQRWKATNVWEKLDKEKNKFINRNEYRCWGFHLKYAIVTSHSNEMAIRMEYGWCWNSLNIFKSMPYDFLCLFPALASGSVNGITSMEKNYFKIYIAVYQLIVFRCDASLIFFTSVIFIYASFRVVWYRVASVRLRIDINSAALWTSD